MKIDGRIRPPTHSLIKSLFGDLFARSHRSYSIRVSRCLSLTLWLSFTLWFTLHPAWAQRSSIRIKLNTEEISERQTLKASVTLELVGVSSGARIIEPSWSAQGWSVVSRSQSTSMQLFGRRQSLEIRYTYLLKPKKTGRLSLGPFKGGGSAEGIISEVKTVTISEGPPKVSKNQSKLYSKYALLKWNVKKKTLWLGERVEAILKVYVNRQLRLTRFTPPEINLRGFWVEDLETQQRSPKVRMGGEVYSQQEIKRSLLTPLKAGTVSLPGISADLSVSNLGFFSEEESFTQSAAEVTLTVKPLPPNPPKGFGGLTVGEVKLSATMDRNRVRIDEGIQLHLQTQTTGLLTNTPTLDLPFIEGMKSFPPTQRESTREVQGKIVSTRTQTWLLKPTREGRVKIPSLSLVYFDPILGQYRVARTRTLTAIVKGGQAGQRQKNIQSASSKSAQSTEGDVPSPEAKPLPTDLLGVQLKSIRADLSHRSAPIDLQWLWLILGILGPLGLLVNELAWLKDKLSASGDGERRKKRAGREALLSLEGLDAAHLDYGLLFEILTNYLGHKLGRGALRGATREVICEALRDARIPETLIEGYVGLAEVADYARFTPDGEGGKQGMEALKLSICWIEEIETHFQLSSMKEGK